MRPDLIEFADRVVPLGYSSHTWVCTMWSERIFESSGNVFVRTKIRESSWTPHQGHGFSSRGWAEKLSALVKIIEGAVYFYMEISRNPKQIKVLMNAWGSFPRSLHETTTHKEPCVGRKDVCLRTYLLSEGRMQPHLRAARPN